MHCCAGPGPGPRCIMAAPLCLVGDRAQVAPPRAGLPLRSPKPEQLGRQRACLRHAPSRCPPRRAVSASAVLAPAGAWVAAAEPAAVLAPGDAVPSVSDTASSSLGPLLDAVPSALPLLAELAPQDAQLLSVVLGPLLAAANLLFIFRIVMSWYPQLPVKDFPFNIAYAPTEPILSITRQLVPPVGGVDVAPVIWLAFFSFINEILLGQQGLLVLISQQKLV